MATALPVIIGEIFRYCVVGVFNTAFCATLMLIGSWLGLGYVLYTVIAYTIAIIVSFALNLKFTFKQSGHTLQRMIIFVVVNLINLFFVQAIQFMFIEQVGMSEIIGVGVGMLFYTLLGFSLNKIFVFKRV